MEINLSEEEQVFRAVSSESGITPANLNPRLSGSTLAKIMEGTYSTEVGIVSTVASRPVNREPRKTQQPKEADSDQVLNHEVLGPISVHVDSYQVLNHEVPDPLAVQNEDDTDRILVHHPLPEPPLRAQVPEPSVPNPFDNTSWLAVEIERLLKKESHLALPEFKFEANPVAAKYNFTKLRENGFNLGELLNPSAKCITTYGSKFKDVDELEQLLSNHPRWKDLKDKLLHGCEFHLEDLPEDQRLQDL